MPGCTSPQCYAAPDNRARLHQPITMGIPSHNAKLHQPIMLGIPAHSARLHQPIARATLVHSATVHLPVCVASMITASDLGKKNIFLSDLVKNYLSGNKFILNKKKEQEQIHIHVSFYIFGWPAGNKLMLIISNISNSLQK